MRHIHNCLNNLFDSSRMPWICETIHLRFVRCQLPILFSKFDYSYSAWCAHSNYTYKSRGFNRTIRKMSMTSRYVLFSLVFWFFDRGKKKFWFFFSFIFEKKEERYRFFLKQEFVNIFSLLFVLTSIESLWMYIIFPTFGNITMYL